MSSKLRFSRMLVAVLTLSGAPHALAAESTQPANLTAVWANEGGDKVAQEELRASSGASVKSSVWDGKTIRIFGARNEVVAFNLVLEAANAAATDVTVTF